jgi:hypothetical protein
LRYHSEKSSTKGQKSGVEDTVRPTEKQGKNYLCTDCKHFIKLLLWLLIFFEYRGIMLPSMNMLKMSSAEFLPKTDGRLSRRFTYEEISKSAIGCSDSRHAAGPFRRLLCGVCGGA